MNSFNTTKSTFKKSLSFTERAKLCFNDVAQKLFLLMDEKKTNLCLSLDITTSDKFLELADKIGPYICLLKTHIDILEDFSLDFIQKLTHLAKKHQFLIFEDRKFADIGHTVKLQYEKGIYHIAHWADIINAHVIAGPHTIEGLKEVGIKKHKALLLLAQMSSANNLITETYTQKAICFAEEHPDFVIGFISMKKLSSDPKWLYLTPGVQKSKGADRLGQQYQTIEDVILKNQSDIIIVGRGIYQAQDPVLEARQISSQAFKAYQKRLR